MLVPVHRRGGGREVRPMCAVTLARPAESLGPGEITAKSR
jgi:hypothetical protein